MASFHFCHRCRRGVDRSTRRKNLFHPFLSFFRTKTRISKRNELTKSIKLEYQSAAVINKKAVAEFLPRGTKLLRAGLEGKGREGKLNDLPAQRPRLADSRASDCVLAGPDLSTAKGKNGRRKKGMGWQGWWRIVEEPWVELCFGDSIDPRGRRCRRGREGRSRLWNRGRGSTANCCARGTPGTINRFHAAVQWRRQLAPSTLI